MSSLIFLNPGISLIETNTGLMFEHWLLLIVIVGSAIFAAKDFKLSLVVGMFLTGGLFIFFYENGYFWAPTLVVFFMQLILLSFTLYAVSKQQEAGAVI